MNVHWVEPMLLYCKSVPQRDTCLKEKSSCTIYKQSPVQPEEVIPGETAFLIRKPVPIRMETQGDNSVS